MILFFRCLRFSTPESEILELFTALSTLSTGFIKEKHLFCGENILNSLVYFYGLLPIINIIIFILLEEFGTKM